MSTSTPVSCPVTGQPVTTCGCPPAGFTYAEHQISYTSHWHHLVVSNRPWHVQNLQAAQVVIHTLTDGTKRNIYLHRVIGEALGFDPAFAVGARNGDRRDCRDSNLVQLTRRSASRRRAYTRQAFQPPHVRRRPLGPERPPVRYQIIGGTERPVTERGSIDCGPAHGGEVVLGTIRRTGRVGRGANGKYNQPLWTAAASDGSSFTGSYREGVEWLYGRWLASGQAGDQAIRPGDPGRFPEEFWTEAIA